MTRRLIRRLILLVPQCWLPERFEAMFFTFDERASRAHSDGLRRFLG